MVHQCVRCSKLFPDGSKELLKGCDCGGKFFFFVRNKDLKDAKELTSSLTDEDKEQIESDIVDLIGNQKSDLPVILDLESIRILKPGKYEISLVDLFSGKPLVFRVGDGKYIIDIASSFKEN